MKLLVGLGNPGPEYEKTRHNVGFMIVDYLQDRHTFPAFSKKFHGLFSQGSINSQKAILLKPATYMNLSGKSVLEAAHFFKIPLEDIIVIHDELDLELGRIKCKIGGSHAGHNGLKSIDSLIGQGYYRLRFGISRPQHNNTASYVLTTFSPEQMQTVEKSIIAIDKHINDIIAGDITKFMNNCALSIRGDVK
jgi:PTH1 family peptidyl-tRNA hydrolase